jgi:hypothetical protein
MFASLAAFEPTVAAGLARSSVLQFAAAHHGHGHAFTDRSSELPV